MVFEYFNVLAIYISLLKRLFVSFTHFVIVSLLVWTLFPFISKGYNTLLCLIILMLKLFQIWPMGTSLRWLLVTFPHHFLNHFLTF